MKKFSLNGKKYDVVPMTFNTVCELEERGIALEDFASKKLGFARAYLSIVTGLEVAEVGIEIENHIKNGGALIEIYEVIGEQIEESDFFRSLQKTTETEAPALEESEESPKVTIPKKK